MSGLSAENWERAFRSLFWRLRPGDLQARVAAALADSARESAEEPDFHCDSGLGGLARWLRALGYDARFWPGIDDRQLISKMIGSTAILLSTDSRLMHHGAIAHGAIAALLVPVTRAMRGQFEFVAAALALPKRPARCMACGGDLLRVEKELLRDRIPPRTYPWRDEYFVCARCDRLFWEGTHWQRIRGQLDRIAAAASSEHVGRA